MKLVFGIMSAVQSAATVTQLAQSLTPHQVVIHHDRQQQPDFSVPLPHVQFVADPKRTGWGVWAFSEGIFHLMRHCVEHVDFDYFQLLSPTCLPIKPMSVFHDELAKDQVDANIDTIDLSADSDALMNFGHRAFAPVDSLRFRLLKRCFLHYYGYEWGSQKRSNLQLRVVSSDSRGPAAHLCHLLTRMAQRGWLGGHLYVDRYRPLAGGTWFGARREVCQFLLNAFDDAQVSGFFSRVHIADELMIATLLGNSQYRIGPSNHLVNDFTAGNPNWLNMNDIQMLKGSERFFARKFPDDPAASVRQAMLTHVGRTRSVSSKVA